MNMHLQKGLSGSLDPEIQGMENKLWYSNVSLKISVDHLAQFFSDFEIGNFFGRNFY